MLYITLRQYEYIVGVADAKSLTQAATLLNVSQPSLSVAITRVEQRLGFPIFARGKGATVRVTPYGHEIVESARKVLKLAAMIEQKEDSVPEFVLGCFEDIAPWYLAPALARLKSAFPSIAFRGREGRFSDLACDLAEGRIDIAISYDIGFDQSFNRQKIAEITPVAFLSENHPLAEKNSVELEELIPYPMILFEEGLSEEFVRDLFERLKLSPYVSQKVTSLEMMRSLAAHGEGIGISYSRPPGDVSYDGKALVTLPIVTPQASTVVKLIWSGLRKSDQLFDRVLNDLSR